MAAAAVGTKAPRIVSNNLVNPSAFLTYSRWMAFIAGYTYASFKYSYLSSYVESEDFKKIKQLQEADINLHTLRAITFHAPQIWDPEYTEIQCKFRDYYPEMYLHPNDEFVYQLTRGRRKEQQVKEELHAEAVAFLKDWRDSEGKN